jgi:hypothetical protein
VLWFVRASTRALAFARGRFLIGVGVGVMLTPWVNVVPSSFPGEKQDGISGSRARSLAWDRRGIVVALSILGSTLVRTTPNRIAIFMVFGAGLAAGLLGQVGQSSDRRRSGRGVWAARLLPVEALYQGVLTALTADTRGVIGVIVPLGPLGGAQGACPGTWLWVLLYTAGGVPVAVAVFGRADL